MAAAAEKQQRAFEELANAEVKLAEAESAAEATQATSTASGHRPLGHAQPSLEVEAVGVGSGSLPAWGPRPSVTSGTPRGPTYRDLPSGWVVTELCLACRFASVI